MKDIKTLLPQSQPGKEASSQTSPTEAGPTEAARASQDALIDAINQVFSLFRLNYHNQYHAAFNDTQLLNQAKRLWKEALQDFDTHIILKAAKRVIEESDYLPTLQKMLSACTAELAEYGIPDVRAAYLEAANAPSPKNAQKWSHPVVYLAGKSVGWYAMSHNREQQTFTEFSRTYKQLVRKFLGGEKLEIDRPPQLEDDIRRKADPRTVLRELDTIKKMLDDE